MTTIAYRDGIIAADSCETHGGSENEHVHHCYKIFRKDLPSGEVLIATAGESSPGMLFVDWYGNARSEMPDLKQSDFDCLIVRKEGVFLVDGWCREIQVVDAFIAIGSGAKVALGAMHAGASAAQAVEIACRVDPHTRGPVRCARLGGVEDGAIAP